MCDEGRATASGPGRMRPAGPLPYCSYCSCCPYQIASTHSGWSMNGLRFFWYVS